jgi:catechol 2,3-dioxygenase-like lactoylglutathione lyase family enzyme
MQQSHQVNKLAPFFHVSDVDRSAAFYGRLGFKVVNAIRDQAGRLGWCFLRSGQAELMLSRGGSIDPTVQAVILYLYADDVAGLRRSLLETGMKDGGAYAGVPLDPKQTDHSIAFEVAHPDWLPAGELRLHDPDGYCVMVGQL